MTPFEELQRNERWRAKLHAAGFRPLAEAWSPAPPVRPPVVRVDVVGDAVRRAASGR